MKREENQIQGRHNTREIKMNFDDVDEVLDKLGPIEMWEEEDGKKSARSRIVGNDLI